MARAAFSYYGGKYYLLPHILPLLPPHEIWVELFCGASWVTLAKAPAACELINDLDDGVVGFYRVLRDPVLMPQLEELLRMTPYARAEYHSCRSTWQACDDPVERARRWFVMARQSFAGKLGWGGWSYDTQSSGGQAARVSAWLNTIEGLPAIHQRLRSVQIECRDWRRVLHFWDRPNVLCYVDPPYVRSTRGESRGYTHEMTDDEHEDLVARLRTFRGYALVSGYAHPIYECLEADGWRRLDIATSAHSAGRTNATGILGRGAALRTQARVETIWWNYDLAAQRGQATLFPMAEVS